jgi:hypothetical protein
MPLGVQHLRTDEDAGRTSRDTGKITMSLRRMGLEQRSSEELMSKFAWLKAAGPACAGRAPR